MKLKAEVREGQGRRYCLKIRKKGFYPGVLYGKKHQPSSLQVEKRVLDAFMRVHAIKTQPFDIELDGKTYNVLVKEIKRSTRYNHIEHLDFYAIEKNKPIVISVPLRYINDENAVGVVEEGGAVEQILHEIEIYALPKNIPSSIEVDLTELALGYSLHVGDIVMPEGCELARPVDEEYNPAIVSIHMQREEEEDPVVEEETPEGEEGQEEASAEEGEDSPSEGSENAEASEEG